MLGLRPEGPACYREEGRAPQQGCRNPEPPQPPEPGLGQLGGATGVRAPGLPVLGPGRISTFPEPDCQGRAAGRVHPPETQATASCEPRQKRQEEGSGPGWTAQGRFPEERSATVGKFVELVWERAGPGWGRLGFSATQSAVRASTSSPVRSGSQPLSPDPRETRSRAVRARGEVLKVVHLQVLHGGTGQAVQLLLLPGDQDPPGGGDHAVPRRDGLPAHLHPRGRMQLRPGLRILASDSRGKLIHLPSLGVHHCLTFCTPGHPPPWKPRVPRHAFHGYRCPRALCTCPVNPGPTGWQHSGGA